MRECCGLDSYSRIGSEDLEEGDNDKDDDNKSQPVVGEAPTWKAVVNMTSFVQGVGILTLPYAVKKGGITTIVAFPLFALVHWYTGAIMVECMYEDETEISEVKPSQPDNKEKASGKVRVRSSYRELGDLLWPRRGALLLDALQNLDLLSLAVSYLISCGSLMAHAFPRIGLTEVMWASIFAVVVLPTTFVKSLSCVAWQSVLALTSLLTMVGFLVWYAATHASNINIQDVMFWDLEGALVAFGLVISSYCVYSILIPVEESMADRSHFNGALGISLNLAAIFKVLFSLCGYLAFTEDTDEVIGNNFPLGVARTTVSVVYVVYVVFTYTLTLNPVFRSIDDSRLASFVSSIVPSFIWSVTTRCFVVILTLLTAVVVPHLALFLAFIGSLLLSLLEYIVPCAVHLKLKFSDLKFAQVAADITIIVTGVLGTIFGTYFSCKALVVALMND